MSVNFAAGCRLYSILCECRLIPCNFVFNIRFIMHCTSPPLLNQLNFLLNLTYLALSMFSPELWKSCQYQQREKMGTMLFVDYRSICHGWLRQTLRALGGGANTWLRRSHNLTVDQSPSDPFEGNQLPPSFRREPFHRNLFLSTQSRTVNQQVIFFKNRNIY